MTTLLRVTKKFALLGLFAFLFMVPMVPTTHGEEASSDKQTQTSCFDFYSFNSVRVRLENDRGNAFAGSDFPVHVTLSNENDYPIVGGSLYIKAYRKSVAGTENSDLVDAFYAITNVSIPSKGSISKDFTWKVPLGSISGSYRLSPFFLVSNQFDVTGLSYSDDVHGSPLDFSVTGEAQGSIYFDRQSVVIDGEKHTLSATPIEVSSAGPVKIAVTLVNDTEDTKTIPVSTRIYRWSSNTTKNYISNVAHTVSVGAHSRSVIEFTLTDQISVPFIELSASDSFSKTIIGIRLTRKGVSYPRLNFIGLKPSSDGTSNQVFACFHGAGNNLYVANGGKVVVSATDDSGVVLGTKTYQGEVSGAMMALAFDAGVSRNTNKIIVRADSFQNGKVADSATVTYTCALDIPCIVGNGQQNLPVNSEKLFVVLATLVGVALVTTVFLLMKKKKNNSINLLLLVVGLTFFGVTGTASAAATQPTISGPTTLVAGTSGSFTVTGTSDGMGCMGTPKSVVSQIGSSCASRYCGAQQTPSVSCNSVSDIGKTDFCYQGAIGMTGCIALKAECTCSNTPAVGQIYYDISFNQASPNASTATRLPGSGYVDSGTALSISKSWMNAGAQKVWARVVGSNGVTSTWASFDVSVTQSFTLNVGVSGSGSVSSNPSGISCGSNCSASYNSGTAVSLTATAGSNSSFTGWDGDCAGVSGTVCNITLDKARTTTARFAGTTCTDPSATNNGGSLPCVYNKTLTLSSSSCGGSSYSGSGAYSNGASVNYSISSIPSNLSFVNWTNKATGAVVSNSKSASITLSTDTELVAHCVSNVTESNCSCSIRGSVSDSDSPNSNLAVRVYRNGPVGTGTMISEQSASLASHRFDVPIPDSLKTGNDVTVWVYALGVDSSGARDGSDLFMGTHVVNCPALNTCENPPLNFGNTCVSGANSCGQTNSGTYGCDGTCSASTPADSACDGGGDGGGDTCPNINGVQSSVPLGMTKDGSGNCVCSEGVACGGDGMVCESGLEKDSSGVCRPNFTLTCPSSDVKLQITPGLGALSQVSSLGIGSMSASDQKITLRASLESSLGSVPDAVMIWNGLAASSTTAKPNGFSPSISTKVLHQIDKSATYHISVVGRNEFGITNTCSLNLKSSVTNVTIKEN